jgi:hypothetical protein
MDARRLVSKVSAWLCGIAGVALLCSAPAWAAGPPTVESESLTKVTATSATLQAELDAQEATTEYHFEYGRCASATACAVRGYEASAPIPDAALGSESAVEEVSFHVQGLIAASPYHMRVVAHNEFGTVAGEETEFFTQATGILGLPDQRAWEMVSPPQKEGARLGWISEGIIQASADGNAFVDMASTSTEPMPPSSTLGVDVFFGRGAQGWTSRVIAPTQSTDTGASVGEGDAYRFFSEDLSKGVVQPFGDFTPLSPQANESTAYLHTNYLSGDPGALCTSDCFTPLVTAANVPAGTVFGEEPNGTCEHKQCGPYFIGANADLSDLVIRSPRVHLTSTSTEGHAGLYEWSSGNLQLVNVLPAGEVNEYGGPVAEPGVSGNANNKVSRGMVSSDGSRIIWLGQTSPSGPLHLYLRDMQDKETTRLDLPNSGVGPSKDVSQAIYATTNSDASRIFFLDEERLTEGSSPQSKAPDLYEYNFAAPVGSRLTDLTPDVIPGESASVASVIGASEDGSYVYFTAGGVLAPGAQPGHCRVDQGESSLLCNLYLRHDGTTKFIAALSPEDFGDWANLGKMVARVSPNGHWLAFMSERDLTGYDNRDAVSGRPDEEVYLYDASTGKVNCASCNLTGARPVGAEYGEKEALAGGDRLFEPATWVAANVPPWTRFSLSEALYQSRYLSDSGRLLFDSEDALSPQDVDGSEDVYEFEPAGVGDCTASSATFSERTDACVALVSSGTSAEESAFLDASQTGSSVFFLTAAKLSSQDFDNATDIYDARECSGPSSCFATPPVPPPPCDTGDSCKAAPSPQPELFGSPASATFAGAGNTVAQVLKAVVRPKSLSRAQKLTRALKACRRKRGRERARCRRQAHARYGAKRAGKPKTTERIRG